MLFQTPLLLLCIVLFMPALAFADDASKYPDDPFAWEHEPVKATEIGTARGQTHLTALGALISGNNSPDTYLGGQLGCEFILHEFGGIRLTGFQEIADPNGVPLKFKFSSIRVGPALHLLPYQRVDAGIYAEGGIVIVDFFDGQTSDKAPEAALGGFVTIHLDSFMFLQLELQRSWANIEINNVYSNQDRTVAMMGLGVAF